MFQSQHLKNFDEFFAELAQSLDISEAQYDAAVKSYEFVGEWLSHPKSPLALYEPEILPQGSFLLGTMIKPIHEEDELDVDLVCRLSGKKESWTQFDLKKIVGDRLKDHQMFLKMLDKEGRRCWTLQYSDAAKFHLDILPAVMARNLKILAEQRSFSNILANLDELAIRITDKNMPNYKLANEVTEWLRSNPFGYATWFKVQSTLDNKKLFSLNEAVQPIPYSQGRKLPLQMIVQILKRHRDEMFKGDCDKPISIIITTLAAKAYKQQINIVEGLLSVVNSMESFIEQKHVFPGKTIKWIANPVNPMENFADKWSENPNKELNFYKWMTKLKADINIILEQRGINNIQARMSEAFGYREVNKAFSLIADKSLMSRSSGSLRMAAGTGILGEVGRGVISQHTNFGNGK